MAPAVSMLSEGGAAWPIALITGVGLAGWLWHFKLKKPDDVNHDDQVARGKRAAEIHDKFNFVVISPLVALTGVALLTKSPALQTALSKATLAYIVADIAWNVVAPECQPHQWRWITIMIHHCVTAALVLHPIMHPENADLTAYCTVVEIQTLLLTAHRLCKNNKFFFQAQFAAWVLLRLGLYPYLVRHFHQRMVQWGAQPSLLDFTYCQVVGSQLVLNTLNFIWTWEVYQGMRKSGAFTKRKDKEQ